MIALEQGEATAGAMIQAGALEGIVAARKGTLGAMLAQHMILLGRQALAPFRIAQVHFVHGRNIGAATEAVNV